MSCLPNLNQIAGIPIVIAFLSIATGQSWAQGGASLPIPSGKHKVGRVSFQWVDVKRPEVVTEAADDKREIVVQVWYPAAKPGRNPASYMPGVERLVSSAAGESLSNLFGPSWRSIASNELRTHSFDKAPVASGTKLPILIFSPGGGVPVVAYTTQMEDLASHGYVVIGVDHTYEAPGVVFPDGRVVTAAHDFLNRLRRQSANTESFEKSLTDMRAADLRFVVDKLQELENDAASIFHARLELTRVGVFGHSRGGRSAARACQLDDRIKACLNQDGSWSWHPFWLDQSGRSLKQPFLMLDHLDPDPTDEVFRKMGTTREQYVGRRMARQAEAREKLYATVAGGSYHVTIKTPGVSHNSFLDIRQLGRPDGAGINAWPEDIRAATPHEHILNTITAWTRAFFDNSIRGVPEPLADLARTPGSEAEIRRYSPRSK
jgi:hypothetical protein